MITIFFPPGAFGSTLEYVIRVYSNEFNDIDATICNDGSMHSFEKEFHPTNLNLLKKIKKENFEIVTAVWPGSQQLTPVEYLEKAKLILPRDKLIFIYFENQEQYELNKLFAFHKIEGFLEIAVKNYKQWNENYTSVNDMALWEIREDLALKFDPINNIAVKNHASDSWLKISSYSILFDFPKILPKIFDYLNITSDNTKNFAEFYSQWFQKQEYVIYEYRLIEKILNNFKRDVDMNWGELSIMAEAIIQSRLLSYGYELQCYSLDIFPNNMSQLKKLLVPIKEKIDE